MTARSSASTMPAKTWTVGNVGQSAKNDDVDVVWQMAALDRGRYRLTAVKRRLETVPEVVELDQDKDGDGLTYRLVVGDVGYPVGTAQVVLDLDELGAPVDITSRPAQQLLRDNSRGARREAVLGASRFRRDRGLEVVPKSSEPGNEPFSSGTTGNLSGDPGNLQVRQ